MTAAAVPRSAPSGVITPQPYDVPTGPIWLVKDSWTEATRHLKALPRNPEQLIFAALMPIMFVVLFVYVFGGSVDVGSFSYKQYVIPGIMAQTVLFNSSFTGVGMAEDLNKGIIDRLRSLPMSPAAVLIGRTVSDVVRNVITFAVMFAIAYAVGFRIQGGVIDAVLATLLLFVFSYAFSWIQALIGLSAGSVEAANSAWFVWMMPLTFASSAFVSVDNMQIGWLRAFARNNPFSVLTNASRALYNGYDAGTDPWIAVAWAVGITVVFAVLATKKFASATSA